MKSPLHLRLVMLTTCVNFCTAYCPTGPPHWNLFRRTCYTVTTSSISWASVSDECQKAHSNATPVSLHDMQADVTVAGMLSPRESNGRGWIGLRRVLNPGLEDDVTSRLLSLTGRLELVEDDDGDDGGDGDDEPRFEWTDGTDVDLTFWDQQGHQPSSDKSKNCAIINYDIDSSFAAWGLEDCANRYPAVCQMAELSCPEGFTPFQDKCLHLSRVEVYGYDIVHMCEKLRPGYQQVSSQSKKMDADLYHLFPDAQHDFWLGLHRSGEDWAWDDGSPFNYSNWLEQPVEGHKCALMHRDNTGEIGWLPDACDFYRAWVMCEALLS